MIKIHFKSFYQSKCKEDLRAKGPFPNALNSYPLLFSVAIPITTGCGENSLSSHSKLINVVFIYIQNGQKYCMQLEIFNNILIDFYVCLDFN